MNFFKSVFSDDPEPSDWTAADASPPNPQSPEKQSSSPSDPNPTPDMATVTNAWNFGSSLFKSLASKSESVIETYRRDLEEFSSGLRKETATIREVASRAVKDLPSRLETGAAVAQEKLESVGEAIDNIGMTMAEIIAQGNVPILADDSDSELNLNSNPKPYNRVDAQIRSIQCDAKTYCEEPEDLEEYNEWKSGFVLDDKSEEIEDLIQENAVIEEIYNEIVPSVNDEVFWSRYFYKVHKVKKAEEARAKLVKRVISGGKEEELSWDVDDDDYEEEDRSKVKDEAKPDIEENNASGKSVKKSEVEPDGKSLKIEDNLKPDVSESLVDAKVGDDRGSSEERLDEPECSNNDKSGVKSDEKVPSEGKADGGSCKDSDFSVVSSHPSSHEEEDLEWDEIEDIGNSDEIKVPANRADLRKRLSAAEEDEDLTWDIEDDDEPASHNDKHISR